MRAQDNLAPISKVLPRFGALPHDRGMPRKQARADPTKYMGTSDTLTEQKMLQCTRTQTS